MRNKLATVNYGRLQTLGRVYLYVRWSSDRQTAGDSKRRQIEAAERWCQQHGRLLSETIIDEGVSAFTGKNRRDGNGLARLLKKVESGDIVLIEDADRHSRQRVTLALSDLEALTDRGVKVIFLKSGVETTKENFDDVIIQNFFGSYLAHAESAKKAARVKASWEARKAAIAQGRPINQNLPSWLRWNRESKQVVQIPERVDIVKRIFALYLAGNSLRTICRTLVTEGVPSISKRRGNQWTVEYLANVLKSRSTIGECLGIPAAFPAIVSEADFYGVLKRMGEARHFTARAHQKDLNLFVGIARCGCCGGPMNLNTFRREGSAKSYLYCGPSLHGKTDCSAKGMRGMPYGLLEKSLLSFLADGDVIRERLSGQPVKPSRLDQLEAKVSALAAQAEKYLKAFEDPGNESPRALARLQEIEAEEAKIRAELEEERAKARAEKPALQAYLEFKAALPALAADKERRAELRRALAGAVEKIIVDPVQMDNGWRSYRVKLRGGNEPILIGCTQKPESWCHRSLQPVEYAPAPA